LLSPGNNQQGSLRNLNSLAALLGVTVGEAFVLEHAEKMVFGPWSPVSGWSRILGTHCPMQLFREDRLATQCSISPFNAIFDHWIHFVACRATGMLF
jgi:hypothetical protein